MTHTDYLRYSDRAQIDQQARVIYDREIRINRETLGIVAATAHANKIAGDWRRKQYNALEATFND